MIRIRGLDHFVLRVRDLDAALGFYHGVLGLEVLFLDEFRAGTRPFVSVRIGTQLLDLVPDPSFDPEAGARAGGFLHSCVEIDGSIEDAVAHLEAKQVRLLDAEPAMRMGATGWGRSIYAADPDGYVVELKERSAPA